MKSPRAVALMHDLNDVPGTLPELFAEQGITLEQAYVQHGLPDLDAWDWVVVMGSPESAFDHRVPWLSAELAWLKALQARGTPTWGICFGSQLLARALGGECYRNSQVEAGWTPVTSHSTQWSHQGPWLNCHFDAITVPPKATLLASTALAVQAYRQGNSLATQFHPEITLEMYDGWFDFWRQDENGQRFLAAAGDLPEQMREELIQRQSSNLANCRALLADFLALSQ